MSIRWTRQAAVRCGIAVLAAASLEAGPGAAAPASPASRASLAKVVTVHALPQTLSGTWEISRGDHPEEPRETATRAFRPISVPGTWQRNGLKQHGFAWYRLRFTIEPGLASVAMAFRCQQIRDSDEVFLDGVLVGRTGRFPPDYDKGTLMARVYPLPPTLTTPSVPHELLIHVYNAGPRGGGITGDVVIDSLHAALVQRDLHEMPRLLLAAAIGALGLFSLFVYLRDRTQLDFLYFFLYTAGFAIYVATWTSAWAETRVPFSLLFRLNLGGNFALFGIFLLFFQHFFERPLRVRHKILLALQVAGTLFCLFWPRVDDLYFGLPLCYLTIAFGGGEILVALVQDARRELPYARPVLAGTAIVLLAVLFDIGQDLGILGDPVGDFRLLGPAFLLFSVIFLSVVADRFARLREAASTDALTGLANRTVLFDRIALEIARGRRNGEPVSLAILDLDHFKTFNDTFGHVIGDRLLVAASKALLESIRDTDLAARYGGEEFVVVLPGAAKVDALLCLERIRRSIKEARVPGGGDGATVSIGLAVFEPTLRGFVSATALLRQADAALYSAKAQGRDRIVVAEGEPPRGSSSGVFSMDVIRRDRG